MNINTLTKEQKRIMRHAFTILGFYWDKVTEEAQVSALREYLFSIDEDQLAIKVHMLDAEGLEALITDDDYFHR